MTGIWVTTAFGFDGYKVKEYRGLVRGIVVRSPTIAQGLLGGLKSIVGGQIMDAYVEDGALVGHGPLLRERNGDVQRPEFAARIDVVVVGDRDQRLEPQCLPHLARLQFVGRSGMERRPPIEPIVGDVSAPSAAVPVFEKMKQSSRRTHFAQHARDEVEPLARVQGMAVERDRRCETVHGVLVPPEEAEELRSVAISSKQLHETFVPDFGFMAVTRL